MSDIKNYIDKNLEEDIEKDSERTNMSTYEYYDLIIKLRTMAYHRRIFKELHTLADVYCEVHGYQHEKNEDE